MSARVARLSAAMRGELAELIGAELKDPRVHGAGLVTVTEVRLTPNLQHADVWVSFVGGDEAAAAAALAALARATGFLRGEIGRRLSLRRAPELRFRHDRSGEMARRIDALLKDDRGGGGGEGA